MRTAIIAGAAAAGVLMVGAASWWATRPAEGPAHGTLSLVTTPPGATLTIAGKEVGTTPYFADNTWQGEVPFEVTKRGYRSWAGTFPGGRETRVEVTLVQKKARRVADAGQGDAGEVAIEFDDEVRIEDDRPLHPRGPLRPPEPAGFVDEDLEREAEGQKK
ncbi:MAG: PEGA domain-containing protein [Myxococcaceae bacterium]|nr:PEGA domain-containing protein [Myxococcaceae bacterium]